MNIPDEKILEHMTHFDFGFKRKITLSYQSWEFPAGSRLQFTPDQSPAEKKALIISAMQFAHRIVGADIKGTLPEIIDLVGENGGLEYLKEFYK